MADWIMKGLSASDPSRLRSADELTAYGRSQPHVGLDELSLFGCNDGSYENISSLVDNVDYDRQEVPI